MVFPETLVNQIEEPSADVCLYTFAECGIVPCNVVLRPVFSFSCGSGLVFEFVVGLFDRVLWQSQTIFGPKQAMIDVG